MLKFLHKGSFNDHVDKRRGKGAKFWLLRLPVIESETRREYWVLDIIPRLLNSGPATMIQEERTP